MSGIDKSLSFFLLLTISMLAGEDNYDFNGDGKADILWKMDKKYSIWYMNATGSHKYKYIGKNQPTYEVVSVADFNGDGKSDILWKMDKKYSIWYMNATGSHKYKYIGKKYAPYEVASNGFLFSKATIATVSSKLFFNGTENTTTVSKTINSGSTIDGVELGFKSLVNMTIDSSFSLKFKNGGFDVSNYYPVLCLGTEQVGTILSLGDNYDSDKSITYNPIFQIASDIDDISRNSLITFHKDSCNNDAQPIGTTSQKDTVIEAKIVNGMTTQGMFLPDYDTNSVKIKVTIKVEAQNQKPTVVVGEDKSVTVNKSITLYGKAKDSDGRIVSYEWKRGDEVLGTEAILKYIPTVAGTETLTLTVTDDDGATASASVEIIVKEESNSDQNDIDKVKSSLSFADIKGSNSDQTEVTTDLKLITKKNGVNISWSSSDTTVVQADGTVIQPSSFNGDQEIKLTATLTKGGFSGTTIIIITVKADDGGKK